MGWLAGYSTRIRIVIDAAKIDAALTDFPVLVKLTDANFDFAGANSDGYDFRFTSADGTTLLKYERERHDSANELAEYWVKVPSVSDSADTYIYLYHRTEDTADGADPENVWDSNSKAVHHLKDNTTSAVLDSTANNNDGAKKAANEPVEAAGQIYKAQDFDGTNDYIDIGGAANLNFGAGDFTYSCWVKTTETNLRMIISQDKNLTNCREFGITSSKLFLFFRDASGNLVNVVSTTSINDNAWHLISGVRRGNFGEVYVDGLLEDSDENELVGSTDGDTNTYICARATSGPSLFFTGLIDEVRISNVARSAAWIKASYHAVADSLLSFYPQIKPGSANFFMLFN